MNKRRLYSLSGQDDRRIIAVNSIDGTFITKSGMAPIVQEDGRLAWHITLLRVSRGEWQRRAEATEKGPAFDPTTTAAPRNSSNFLQPIHRAFSTGGKKVGSRGGGKFFQILTSAACGLMKIRGETKALTNDVLCQFPEAQKCVLANRA